MSLYDDDVADSGKDGTNKSPWSDSLKLLQGSIHAKKFHQQQMKRDVTKGVSAPVADLRRKRAPVLPRHPPGEVTFNSITGKMELRESTHPPVDLSGPPASVTALIQNITSSMSVFGYNDEYDPIRPNDYAKLKEQRKREQQQRERESERQKMEEEEPRGLYDDYGDDDHEEDQLSASRDSVDRSLKKGNAFAPPPSLVEEDKRAGGSNSNDSTDYPSSPRSQSNDYVEEMETDSVIPTPGFGSTKGAMAAAKMMAKMGYVEGQGLGKSQQGMSSALVVEKTSKRGGKILHEKDLTIKEPVFVPPPPPPPVLPNPIASTSNVLKGESGVDIAVELKNATKVVLLKNMVGPGEVDDLLDSTFEIKSNSDSLDASQYLGETKEECQKYGEVEQCLIFEIPDAPEDEAVRIFVEFKRVESAIKAVVAMNGRYFAGRVVRAKFYDFEKFRQFDLADDS